MRPVLSAKQMAQIDQKTLAERQMSSFQLMDEVAGEMLESLLTHFKARSRFLVVCGPGNNGGDGYRVAEKLRSRGHEVWVKALYDPGSEDCRRAADLYKGKLLSSSEWPSFDCIVDAVFGCFGRAQLDKKLERFLSQLCKIKAFKVALDVPSGVDSQKCMAHPKSFQADLTLCVAYPKTSFSYESVSEFLGEVEFVGSQFAVPKFSSSLWLEDSDCALPQRKRTSHKSGKCGIVAGSKNSPGAAFLAAEAAARVGAGYSSLFFSKAPKSLKIQMQNASFLYRTKWTATDLASQDALVVGPGGAPRSLRVFAKQICPQVFDAEAIRIFKPSVFKNSKAKRVLTPHPGEAAGLLGSKASKIIKDPLGSLEELSRKTGQSIYLKGAPGHLKFAKSSQTYVNFTVNPAFATAGSGDVLAGIMGGLLAQQPEGFENAVISSLLLQRRIGVLLKSYSASLSSDQLMLFSKAIGHEV